MAMTQRAVTLNIQPIAAPCLRHSATGQPVTIFASRLNVILRRVVYHRDGNFPGESGEFRGTPEPFRTVRAMPEERRARSRCCRRGHSVERSRPPSRRLSGTGPPGQNNPGQYNPATTLSNADTAGDLSGDGGTSGALLHGDCFDVMARLPDSCFRAVVTSPHNNLRNSSGNGMRDERGGKWEQAALF